MKLCTWWILHCAYMACDSRVGRSMLMHMMRIAIENRETVENAKKE